MPKKCSESIEKFLKDKKALMEGYIRPVSNEAVSQYKKILEDSAIWENEEPFAITVFGDIITYDEEDYITMFKFTEGIKSVICASPELFFMLIDDVEYQKDYFDMESYTYAKNKLGVLLEGESYTYEPIPALGGNMAKESLSKGKTLEYLVILASFMKMK